MSRQVFLGLLLTVSSAVLSHDDHDLLEVGQWCQTLAAKEERSFADCAVSKDLVVVMTEELVDRNKVVMLRAYELREEDSEPTLVYEEVTGIKLAQCNEQYDEHLRIEDINEDGFDELAVCYYSAQKNLRIYSLKPDPQEYLGKLEFVHASGKRSFHLNVPETAQIFRDNGVHIEYKDGNRKRYEALEHSFNEAPTLEEIAMEWVVAQLSGMHLDGYETCVAKVDAKHSFIESDVYPALDSSSAQPVDLATVSIQKIEKLHHTFERYKVSFSVEDADGNDLRDSVSFRVNTPNSRERYGLASLLEGTRELYLRADCVRR